MDKFFIEILNRAERLQKSLKLSSCTINKELLGKGGYGVVYKGYLRSTPVAIKYLTEVKITYDYRIIIEKAFFFKDGEKALCAYNRSTFQTEIAALSKYKLLLLRFLLIVFLLRFRHHNLVELMGYCIKPPCIVYEFLEKGCLFSCLHDANVRYKTNYNVLYNYRDIFL